MLSNILISLCIAGFVAILFLNIYFRVKVLKTYRYLVQNRVMFNNSHVFNKQKLEEEVLSRYPQHREQILTFCNNIRFSVKCASALIVVITILAATLMFIKD